MSNFNIDYLVVAGGGSGGTRRASGGGAGGLRTSYGSTSGGGSAAETELTLNSGTTYTITVGDGGNIPTFSGTVYLQNGEKGQNSSITGADITSIVSEGGGGGMSISSSQTAPDYSLQTGGSGAGASAQASTSPGLGATGQGYNGGNACAAASGGYGGGGGGGGAGSAGSAPPSCGAYSSFASGGNGLAVSITGSSVTYAEGGPGVNQIQPSMPAAPTANTGSGGCGGTEYSHVNASYMPKAGAEGIVILRYATADITSYAATGITPTETTDGADTILSFITVGTGTITFTASIPPFSGTKVSNELLDFNQQNNEIGLRIPVGNDTDQPTADVSNTGSIRYNTDQQGLSISNGTEFQVVDSEQSTLPTVTLTNSWRAWDTASFVNGGTSCTDVTGGLVLGPYSSGSPGAFFYSGWSSTAGNKFWLMNGGGSHGRRAGFTRPTEFTISYWGYKKNNPGYNSDRGIWAFNAFGTDHIRLVRRNNANTQSLRVYSGNSAIATFADGINLNAWYNITLTFSLNTVKTYVGVQGSTNTTLINTTTLSSGNFPTGILNDSNGTGFWTGTTPGYTDWTTDDWSSLSIYDGVARQAEIDTIVSNGYQQ